MVSGKHPLLSTPQNWRGSRACGEWPSTDNEEEVSDKKKHINPLPPLKTELVPEFMEHDREEADNDKEGEEVSGRKEKYLKSTLEFLKKNIVHLDYFLVFRFEFHNYSIQLFTIL